MPTRSGCQGQTAGYGFEFESHCLFSDLRQEIEVGYWAIVIAGVLIHIMCQTAQKIFFVCGEARVFSEFYLLEVIFP